MTDFTSISFPPPKDWQAFERATRVLFQCILQDSNTQNNGRIGQPQHGVDVFGNRGGGGGPMVGVQCKGKDRNFGGSVTPEELETEVRKSAGFRPELREFILVTTAPQDAKIQETARLLEQKVRAKGRELSVAVWGWEHIESEIARYPEAINAFHPDATPFTRQILDGQAELLKELRRLAPQVGARDERAQTPILAAAKTQIAADAYVSEGPLDKHLHDQIDTYRELLRADRPKTALELLEKLRAKVFAEASNKIKFRITANIGSAHHRLGHYETAADYFLEASGYGPDEVPGLANKIAALLIKQRFQEAHDLAVHAAATHSESADIALQRLQARSANETVEALWNGLPVKVRNDPNLILFRIMSLREGQNREWRSLVAEAAASHPENHRLKILKAESVLDRLIESDRSLLGVQHADEPNQAELREAAEVLQAAWDQSRKLETPPETSLAHNGALLWRLLRDANKARQMLDEGIAVGLDADETIKLRLSLFRRPDESADALKLSEKLSDTPQGRIIRAELYIDSDPAKSRSLLAERAHFTGRDIVPAAQVFVESLLKEGKFDEAMAEAERAAAALPNDPNGSLIKYRIKLARADENAQRDLDEALKLARDFSDFPTRFLVCEALEKAKRFDDVVDLLHDRVSTKFDSMALRSLVAAAANSDRRSTLKELLTAIPRDLKDEPFYQNAHIALSIKVGDIKAAERGVRSYLAQRPRNLAMHLQLMHTLFRQDKIDALRGEAAKPASDFDGTPIDFMHLAQFKEDFGDWREAYALAYETLLKNLTDSTVSMGYIAIFLHTGHSTGLEISPTSVSANMAVTLIGEDKKPHVFVLEPIAELRPTAQYLPLNHKLALALLGQGLNAAVQLPDGTPANITSIKPKELYALHELIENFQNIFPDASGLERVRFDPSSTEGMQAVSERLQERHDAVEQITTVYENGGIPLSLAARALGTDVIDLMVGLRRSGHEIRVSQGTQIERDTALAAIDANGRKGCILDAMTFHAARRLELIDAVRAECGDIGIVDRTVRRLQRKIYEIGQRIDEPDLSLSWSNGNICRSEVSVEEKRQALVSLQDDAQWLASNATIVPAEGAREQSPTMRELMHRFGSGFADELRAAQGSDYLLVSEDFMMRGIAQAEFGVRSTWLQPILMKAKNSKSLSADSYRNALVAMIDAQFTFISIDVSVLSGSVQSLREIDLPADFRKLASRLGGKDADLGSHLNVAFGTILQTWTDKAIPWTARLAIVGTLLTEMIKERQRDQARAIIQAFLDFAERTLNDYRFEQYIRDWLRGHFLIL